MPKGRTVENGGTLVGRYLYATRVNNLSSSNTDAVVGFTIDSSGALTPLAGSPFLSSVPLWGGIATSVSPAVAAFHGKPPGTRM